MKKIFPNLYQSEIDHPFGNEVETCAYFLIGQEKNFLFYSSSKIEKEFDFIQSKGGVSKQFLNHRDEASKFNDVVWKRFQAPLVCNEKERAAIEKKCHVGQTFSQRHFIEENLEALLTPGHCPGSSCYLWHDQERRLLFTGDTLYLDKGSWKVNISRGTQEEMIESLLLIKELEFDVLVPSLYIGNISYEEVNAAQKNKKIETIMERLHSGSIH